ncbi:MAG: iron ABC transporter permease [archaeon]|nr:iron ABC transporter permease [archaeon]
MSGNAKTAWKKSEYLARRHKVKIAIIVLLVITTLASIYSLSMTQYPISFTRMLEIVYEGLCGITPTDYEGRIEHKVIWEMYMPRVLAGLMVGAILGMAGAVMQSVIDNPLADPYTTGISSGAAFGVALFTVYGFTVLPLSSDWAMIANAFVFAMIPCAAILLFATLGRGTSSTMILVGIAIMMVFGSATQLIMFSAEPSSFSSIYEWNIGSLALVKAPNLPFLVASITVLAVALIPLSKYLVIMTAGDRIAKTVGVNAKMIRSVSFFIVSACTAIAVSFTGSIGFVGLVIPHLCRIIVGSSKGIIILSGLIGGLMLMTCDIVARLIILGGLPVGVITAAIGSPIFIYFLIRSRKGSYYG